MNVDELSSRLFFLVGCGRSGTTLLKSILGAHPSVYLPPETFFFSTIRRRFHGGDGGLDRKLRYICSRWWMREAGLRPDTIRAHLAGNDDPDWHELFLAVLSSLVPEGRFAAVGEKTPAHVVDSPHLLATYPDCRVIQIVRDPRAVLSSYRSVKVGPNEAAGVAPVWEAAMAAHWTLVGHPRYLMIRYEALVTDPEAVLRRVCQHLRLNFNARMLAFHEREAPGYPPEQEHHAATRRPLFLSSLEAWREKLPRRQLLILESLLAIQMERIGYQVSVGMPALRLWDCQVSSLRDQLHRGTIRRARQLLKQRRALRRILSEQNGGREA